MGMQQLFAAVAHQAEHMHGKHEVPGSSPGGGSRGTISGMTTRQEVDEALRKFAAIPRHLLPRWLLSPKTEDEFAIAIVLATKDKPGVSPVYDENDELIAFKGIGLKR